MNAGRILAESGYDSKELRSLLRPIRPEDVNVWPAAKWVRRFWRPGVGGVTQWRWVFVDPSLFGDKDRLARLVIHELVHVRQFREQGYLRFMFRYVSDYWRARRGGMGKRDAYLAIPAEIEARELTVRVT